MEMVRKVKKRVERSPQRSDERTEKSLQDQALQYPRGAWYVRLERAKELLRKC